MTQVPGEPEIVDVDEPEAVPIEADPDEPDEAPDVGQMGDEREFVDAEMVDEPDIVDRN